MTDALRLARIHGAIAQGGFEVSVLRATADGHVTVRIDDGLDAAERGILLRALERYLKANVDAGLVVYLEPAQDRNALRRLRGVKVAE